MTKLFLGRSHFSDIISRSKNWQKQIHIIWVVLSFRVVYKVNIILLSSSVLILAQITASRGTLKLENGQRVRFQSKS
jgi:hypothetical protein